MPALWTGEKKNKQQTPKKQKRKAIRKVITDDVGSVLYCGSYR